MWKEVSTGKFKYRPETTTGELMAKYVALGADLRELKEYIWTDTARSIEMIDEMIQSHSEIMSSE